MNTAFFKGLVGVFVVLLIIVLAPIVLGWFRKDDTSITIRGTSIDLSGFAESSVARLSVEQKGTKKIVFDRSGDSWKIESGIADSAKVSELFKVFSELRVVSMVSKNEDAFQKFGVDRENAIRLVFRGNDGKESLFLVGGEDGPSQAFFFRKDGIKNTYAVRGALRSLLLEDVSYWKRSEDQSSTTNGPISGT